MVRTYDVAKLIADWRGRAEDAYYERSQETFFLPAGGVRPEWQDEALTVKLANAFPGIGKRKGQISLAEKVAWELMPGHRFPEDVTPAASLERLCDGIDEWSADGSDEYGSFRDQAYADVAQAWGYRFLFDPARYHERAAT